MDIRDLKPVLKKLLRNIEKHVPYASVLAACRHGRYVSVDMKTKRVAFYSPNTGVVFSAWNGRHFVERATTDTDEASLARAADDLVGRCKEIGTDMSSDLVIEPGDNLEKEFFVEVLKDPFELSLQAMLDEAVKFRNRASKSSDFIANFNAVLGHVTVCELFINSTRCLYQELPRWDTTWSALLRRGGDSVMAHGGDCRLGGCEHIRLDETQLADKIKLYEKLLGAQRLPDPGVHDCVFSPGVSGLLAHEAFGHGTETDMFIKGRARGIEYMGKRVAADGVNMYDSPALPGLPGSFFFDHEGNLATETQIIDNGILVNGISDVNSALRLGYDRTSNGRREDFSHKVYARMTNTYFGAGDNSYEEMIGDISHGYLVGLASNGMEDPKGWGVQCEASLAREIRDGRLTDNFYTPVVITGYVPDLLESISMVGDELQFCTMGMCGKGKMKEFVRVSYGAPFLRLRARIA